MNGLTLADVQNLVYYVRYTTTGDAGGLPAPYLRIFLEDGAGEQHDMVFTPLTQAPDPDVAEGPFHEWVATSGLWRYDDDAGNGPSFPFADLVAEHATEEITMLVITTGASGGTDLNSLLRWWQINGETFSFRG
jgi:hypothetical protein